MRSGGRRGSPLRWVLVAALLVLAAAAAASFHEGGSDRVERVVLGDLRLSDGDEGPSHGVERTFYATNVAPGDVYVDALTISREPFRDRVPAGLEARVAIDVRGDAVPSPLAKSLDVVVLEYGDLELGSRARGACGSPLTLAALMTCSSSADDPLEDLPDPTPEGRAFRLGVRMDAGAGQHLQGARAGFTVYVHLYGDEPRRVEPLVYCRVADAVADEREQFPSLSGGLPGAVAPAPSVTVVEGIASGGPSASQLIATELPVSC